MTEATLSAYAAAWLDGDIERVLSFYGDDVVFHYFGSSELAGTHLGKAASVAAMAGTASRASRRLVGIVDVLAGESLGSIVAVEEFARSDVGVDAVQVRRTFLYRVDEAGDDSGVLGARRGPGADGSPLELSL